MEFKDKASINISSADISLKDLIFKTRQWFRYLFSKWILIVFFGLLGGVLGYVYALFKKPVYIASTTFVLEDIGSGNGLGGLGGLASMVGIDVGSSGGIFQGDNILELYRSRKMIQATLLTEIENRGTKELLVDHYLEVNQIRKNWKEKPELKGFKFTRGNQNSAIGSRLQDSILGVIINDINRNYLSVSKPDKKLGIIKVEVKAQDEFFAKMFNDEIVKNVNDFYIQTKTIKSSNNVRILQQKTDSVRSVMNGAIYRSVAVSDATPNLNPTRQVERNAPIQKAQFSAETNKAVLAELVKNLEISKVSLLKETPLIQVIDKPIFPLEKIKSGKLRGALIGGIMLGLISIIVITIKRMFEDILAEN